MGTPLLCPLSPHCSHWAVSAEATAHQGRQSASFFLSHVYQAWALEPEEKECDCHCKHKHVLAAQRHSTCQQPPLQGSLGTGARGHSDRFYA